MNALAIKKTAPLGHYFQRIEGWFSFRALYAEVVREAPDPAHFVEVGCWKGRSAAFMAVEIVNSGKTIAFDCVDTWLGSPYEKHQNDPDVKAGRLYDVFLDNLAPVCRYLKGGLTVKRLPSIEAAQLYSDGSLDFVFIDGDHEYKAVKADIEAWLPKVKRGGVIAGDDYRSSGVGKAVIEKFPYNAEGVPGSGSGLAWWVRC